LARVTGEDLDNHAGGGSNIIWTTPSGPDKGTARQYIVTAPPKFWWYGHLSYLR